MAALSLPARTAPVTARSGHSAITWTFVYVGAWIIGLFVTPSAPAIDAPAADVQAHYIANGGPAAVQSLLVHGVAGVALGGVAVSLTRSLLPNRVATKIARYAGAGAVSLSLLQVVVLQLLMMVIDGTTPERTLQFIQAINLLDSAKLVALGLFIAAVSSGARPVQMLPRWLRSAGVGVAVLLPVSGAAFLFNSPSLYVLLYASLPLLLAWILAATVATRPSTAA